MNLLRGKIPRGIWRMSVKLDAHKDVKCQKGGAIKHLGHAQIQSPARKFCLLFLMFAPSFVRVWKIINKGSLSRSVLGALKKTKTTTNNSQTFGTFSITTRSRALQPLLQPKRGKLVMSSGVSETALSQTRANQGRVEEINRIHLVSVEPNGRRSYRAC